MHAPYLRNLGTELRNSAENCMHKGALCAAEDSASAPPPSSASLCHAKFYHPDEALRCVAPTLAVNLPHLAIAASRSGHSNSNKSCLASNPLFVPIGEGYLALAAARRESARRIKCRPATSSAPATTARTGARRTGLVSSPVSSAMVALFVSVLCRGKGRKQKSESSELLRTDDFEHVNFTSIRKRHQRFSTRTEQAHNTHKTDEEPWWP